MDRSNLAQHADAHFSLEGRTGHAIQMNRSAQIMTAGCHASFLQAGQILERAGQMAAEKMLTANDGYQEACDRGYRDGIEKAHQKNILEHITLAHARSGALTDLESNISDMVIQTIRQVLGEIDRNERVFMLVRQALVRLGQLQGDVALYVHPDLLESVNTRLLSLNKANQGSHLKTIADPAIALEACRIVSGSGSMEGDLQQQIAALEAALQYCPAPSASPDVI